MKCRKIGLTRRGFTLLELAIVVGVVGLLAALLIPAVLHGRAAARRAGCANNVRQLALANLLHHDTFGRFPSGGWGNRYLYDPRRGAGHRQPGGWCGAVLPYLERGNVLAAARSQDPAAFAAAMAAAQSVSLPGFRCPDRSAPVLGEAQPPLIPGGDVGDSLVNAPFVPRVAKTDYAANAGASGLLNTPGPPSVEAGDASADRGLGGWWLDPYYLDGVVYQRSGVPLAAVTDGASNVYLLGEKAVRDPDLSTGGDWGYDGSLLVGADEDTLRSTNHPPARDGEEEAVSDVFGSAHADGFQMAFCDGRVETVGYGVDPLVHLRRGDRGAGWTEAYARRIPSSE